MSYELLGPTKQFIGEMDTAFDGKQGTELYLAKDRAIVRAQAVAAADVHGRTRGLGGTREYRRRIDDASKAHAAALGPNQEKQRHTQEVVLALMGYAMYFHRARWLTWWAVAAAFAGVIAGVSGVVGPLVAACRK
jgi:hypothetical protein